MREKGQKHKSVRGISIYNAENFPDKKKAFEKPSERSGYST